MDQVRVNDGLNTVRNRGDSAPLKSLHEQQDVEIKAAKINQRMETHALMSFTLTPSAMTRMRSDSMTVWNRDDSAPLKGLRLQQKGSEEDD